MKAYLITLFILSTFSMLEAQEMDYNLKGGYIAKGYDVVSYFSGTPEKGNKDFTHQYNDIKFKFVNQANLDRFKQDPEQYIPQYGGWCAYAMGVNGEKVKINPKTFEITDGKLYLFYNSWGNNTLEKWNEENKAELKKKADEHWNEVRYTKK
ncbi:MAG: YHS domain-containing (seleno)protein [Bacteroidota bacterium]